MLSWRLAELRSAYGRRPKIPIPPLSFSVAGAERNRDDRQRHISVLTDDVVAFAAMFVVTTTTIVAFTGKTEARRHRMGGPGR